MRAAVVLLAAGGSSRLGTPKQLLEYRGRSLLRHSAETAIASLCEMVCVVLGSESDQMAEELSGLPVQIVYNAHWADGMGTSIASGVAALPEAIDSVILALCDQPLVTADILDALIAAHIATGKPVVASEYSGTVGVPALFSSECFGELQGLNPNQGCKSVILSRERHALRIPCHEAAVDVDTADDYRQLRESALRGA